jgi:hypothetical protein
MLTINVSTNAIARQAARDLAMTNWDTEDGLRVDLVTAFRRVAKNIPYAASRALNDTAAATANAVNMRMKLVFRNPRPFVQRGGMFDKSTKNDLTAAVYINPRLMNSLGLEESGGWRIPKEDHTVNVPKNYPKLNQYGSMGGPGQHPVASMIRTDATTFVGTVHGVYGLWRRTNVKGSGEVTRRTKKKREASGLKTAAVPGAKKGVILVVRFDDRVPYKPRLGFEQFVPKYVATQWDWFFDNWLQEALKPKDITATSANKNRARTGKAP